MAFSYRQIDKISSASTVTTLTCAFGTNTLLGSVVVVAGNYFTATGVTISNQNSDVVTDSGLGNLVWSNISSTGRSFCKAFFRPQPGTNYTVTYTGTAAFPDLYIWEITGFNGVGTFDKFVSGTGTGTAVSSGTTAALTSTNEIAIGFAMSGTITAAGSGWTTGQGSLTTGNSGDGIDATTKSLGEHRILAGSGSISATGTNGASVAWGAWCATIKEVNKAIPLFQEPQRKNRPIRRITYA
jgi:hypothetical protein